MPNLLIDAGPGCGKTHSITDAYIYSKSANPAIFKSRFQATDEQMAIYEWVRAHFPKDAKYAAYCAYNKDIVADMLKKVHPDCTDFTKTLHGHGYAVIKSKYGYIKLNEKRGEILVEKITGQNLSMMKDKFNWISTLRYVDKLKDELLPIEEESFYKLQMKYSDLAPFKIHPDICSQAAKLVTAMKSVDRAIGISYSDQIWLALFLLPKPLYKFGFVDECQDLSPARLRLAQMLCENIVFCGDKNQGINAWNGADPYAIDQIREHCETSMPLKLSFRLPPNHARTCNMIRQSAQLRTLPGRSDGIEETVDCDSYIEWSKQVLDENPMIVCRYNAPLVQLALAYIQNGIPCRLLGSSEITNLINTVKNRNASTIDELHQKLNTYENQVLKVGNEMAKELNKKRFDSIRYVLKSCSTVSDFEPLIKSLGNPPKTSKCITLSTVHGAKGREAKVIGILNPPIPSDKAKESVQIEQEINTDFVGHSRTKQDRYYVYTR